jgi:predicted AlkP superfamily pyrophosphatase or phosphodiesterase
MLAPALISLLCLAGCETPQEPPRLAVVLVVDQMRADYLTRFEDQFESGLARIAREGAAFTEAHHEHAATLTAPGHATIATGTHPAKHGIVGNSWWDRTEQRRVSSVGDEAITEIGRTDGDSDSPHRLLRTTLGDWLTDASPRSKVLSVALKSRSAVLLGGRQPDGAYWIDGATGRFVTSTYYRDAYPEWVDRFNDGGFAQTWVGGRWDRLLDEAAYGRSREDAFPTEADGENTTFPHRFGETGEADATYYRDLYYSPHGDELTLEFARTAIVEEDLGGDDAPDLVWIGASSADAIGHAFGPYSQEVHDYYLQLDRLLGDFLGFLDDRLGPDGYVLVLTSDHGVVPMPEESARRGSDARRIGPEEIGREIDSAIERASRKARLRGATPGYEYSNGVVIQDADGEIEPARMARFRETLAEALREIDFVEDAFTRDTLADADESADRPLLERYRNGFHPDRAADVVLRFRELDLPGMGSTSTNHGSPYAYDSHVPLIFMGSGIAAGSHDEPVGTVDIAPTLARILGVTAPADLDGRGRDQALPSP